MSRPRLLLIVLLVAVAAVACARRPAADEGGGRWRVRGATFDPVEPGATSR